MAATWKMQKQQRLQWPQGADGFPWYHAAALWSNQKTCFSRDSEALAECTSRILETCGIFLTFSNKLSSNLESCAAWIGETWCSLGFSKSMKIWIQNGSRQFKQPGLVTSYRELDLIRQYCSSQHKSRCNFTDSRGSFSCGLKCRKLFTPDFFYSPAFLPRGSFAQSGSASCPNVPQYPDATWSLSTHMWCLQGLPNCNHLMLKKSRAAIRPIRLHIFDEVQDVLLRRKKRWKNDGKMMGAFVLRYTVTPLRSWAKLLRPSLCTTRWPQQRDDMRPQNFLKKNTGKNGKTITDFTTDFTGLPLTSISVMSKTWNFDIR